MPAFVFLLIGDVEAIVIRLQLARPDSALLTPEESILSGFANYLIPLMGGMRDMTFYTLTLIFLTSSTTAGAINFITTILRLRAPRMAISRMPLCFYSTLTVSASVHPRHRCERAHRTRSDACPPLRGRTCVLLRHISAA